MSKLGSWSTTAGSNNATPPDGWPEGQAPSTVNDCAREMMASIRTVFNDAQFFDGNLTPTFVNTTSFTVAGDQTSAMHAGRRLKLFDGGNVNYAEILAASFTAVTTISVSAASALTASLSSFAVGLLHANTNSSALPRRAYFDFLTASSMAVPGNLSVSTLVATGPTRLEDLSCSDLVVTGTTLFKSTVTCSATLAAENVCKAWVRFSASGSVAIVTQFNVSSVSRSAAGVYRININNPLADANYCFHINAYDGAGGVRVVEQVTLNANNFKFRTHDASGSVKDCDVVCASFYR